MTTRTLADLRQTVPVHDLNTEALRKPPLTDKRGAKSRYIPVDLRPRTLEQLHTACEPYGDVAVKQAVWAAMCLYTMWPSSHPPTRNNAEVVCLSCILCRDEDANRGYPKLTGGKRNMDIKLLSQGSQAEARKVAAETRDDWELAGKPYLDRAIQSTHEYIYACKRMIEARNTEQSN